MHDGARHGDSLPLAPESSRPMPGRPANPTLARASPTLRRDRGPAAVAAAAVLDVFERREHRDQVEGLKDEPILFGAAWLIRRAQRLESVPRRRCAAGGLVDASDQIQQRRLAAALGPATARNSPAGCGTTHPRARPRSYDPSVARLTCSSCTKSSMTEPRVSGAASRGIDEGLKSSIGGGNAPTGRRLTRAAAGVRMRTLEKDHESRFRYARRSGLLLGCASSARESLVGTWKLVSFGAQG